MADLYFSTKIYGLRELSLNIKSLSDSEQAEKIVKAALTAGAKVISEGAKAASSAAGYGRMGVVKDKTGREYRLYGRIPRSYKVGRAKPANWATRGYVSVRVVASRSKKRPFNSRAHHAHLVEYGFTRRGAKYPGHPMLNKALEDKAGAALRAISKSLEAGIQKYKFPYPTGGGKH